MVGCALQAFTSRIGEANSVLRELYRSVVTKIGALKHRKTHKFFNRFLFRFLSVVMNLWL